MRPTLLALFSLLALVHCGGNVVVDAPGSSTGGATTGSTTGTGGATTGSTTGTGAVTSGTFTTSTATSTTSSSSGQCGSLHLSSTAECTTCLDTSCCKELVACDKGTACGAIVDCLVNCPANDQACGSNCAQSIPAGTSDLMNLASCLNGSCQACNTGFTGVCDSGLDTGSLSCGVCLTAECCTEAEHCAGSGTCQKCFLSGNQPPSCDPTYATLAQCRSTRCAKACP